MTDSVTRAADGNTFALSLNGKSQTYTNDKEGKRQAILDGLNAIETMAVGENVYLPSNESLRVVAAVLYPDGIQTEAAYQTVCQVTEKACAHLGYGGEVELGPPAVPFARRGAYRRQYPPVDDHLVRDELALAGTGSSVPRQEIACTILWNKAGMAVYGRHWSKLADAEQSLIQTQVDAIAAQAGWEKDNATATGSYTKPLPVDEATARSRLDDLLRRENGRPVLVSNVIYQAQLGAYGRGFYSNELAPLLQTIVSETLQAHGYRPTPQDGEYRPLPVTLAAATETNLQEELVALSPVMTELGQALLLRDVVEALGVASISEWQAEQLVADGRVSQALRKVGYQTELTWCQPYHFRPKRDDHEAQRVILKEVRVKNDPTRKLSLAQGLAVLTPALAIDDVDETLVYLEMVGAKQSVKANWAALVGGGKVHWIGRKRIRLDGMKEHVKIQATLPCGWANHILIHKQASLKEMNPEQPF
ncbi:MAG: hypothetical protein KC449_13450, partial [Anaerolineales bacterium]|nr:hypothetical protein [Anaerolineales bacterium]